VDINLIPNFSGKVEEEKSHDDEVGLKSECEIHG